MHPQYMSILIYVTLIWCNSYSIDVLSIGVWGYMYPPVYVHSADYV